MVCIRIPWKNQPKWDLQIKRTSASINTKRGLWNSSSCLWGLYPLINHKLGMVYHCGPQCDHLSSSQNLSNKFEDSTWLKPRTNILIFLIIHPIFRSLNLELYPILEGNFTLTGMGLPKGGIDMDVPRQRTFSALGVASGASVQVAVGCFKPKQFVSI